MEMQEARLALPVLICKNLKCYMKLLCLTKMATTCNFVARPECNPFILQAFVAFAEPGLLLIVSWALLIADSRFTSWFTPACDSGWRLLNRDGATLLGVLSRQLLKLVSTCLAAAATPSERYRITTTSVLFFLRKYTAYGGGKEGSRRTANQRTHLLLNYSFNY